MGTLDAMIARHIVRSLGPAVVIAASGVAASALTTSVIPSASAQCPDVQVVFARGTGEAPGVGPTGQAFVDALHQRVGGRSFDVYPVNYPASDQWDTGIEGIRDAGAHINSMAQDCPNTKMVLGGYSQGAAVMGFVTSASVPDGVDPNTVPKPLAPEVANHVSSVVLFGMPNVRAMNFLGEPPVVIGPQYQDKTVKVCATEDPVCSDGLNFAAHNTYADDGAMIDKGVAFASSHLGLGGAAPVAAPVGGGFGS
ncbi:cutinase family protein [Mycobacterium sp. 852002-40037_SCH5390672]|uniref:cutinase family protein n=1 Tax=Mycobacterium sp. 852002-40037_SCH5390672 TaxID=1834089 RepID=UPI000805D217|nr:cutinase family protein [Mycobacterium sp. 852002-40037_SCH5390672]OBC00314.1 cutinase [Mycobacterium sp. 852002-40037_SCH5390672]